MVKNIKVFLKNLKKCNYGAGYFHLENKYIPNLQVDRRFGVSQPGKVFKKQHYVSTPYHDMKNK